jgi:glycosyltransferase involved in cell wall biosynthesis
MKPKISVAMTTYNGQRFLKEQLGGMLAQSRGVDELVVCDDGSGDNTVDILKGFASNAPFPVKIVVNERNLGSVKNFEKAISLCAGDIIVLCDQDDVWLPDKVKILENVFLTNNNCGMAFTDAMIIDEADNPQGRLWARFNFGKREQKIIKKGKGFKFFADGNIVTGATAAITKPFFEEAAPFPERFVHDHWLAMVAVSKGKLFFSDAVTVNYRRHSSQQIGTPAAEDFLRRAGKIVDYDKAVDAVKTMRDELGGRFNLTEEQRKIFADMIEFYLFRKDIPRSGLTRVPKIIKRLAAGKYHLFATGFLSAAKDMIR